MKKFKKVFFLTVSFFAVCLIAAGCKQKVSSTAESAAQSNNSVDEVYSYKLSEIKGSSTAGSGFTDFDCDKNAGIYNILLESYKNGIFLKVKPENIKGVASVKYVTGKNSAELTKKEGYFITGKIALEKEKVTEIKLISTGTDSSMSITYVLRVNCKKDDRKKSDNADLQSIETAPDRTKGPWTAVTGFSKDTFAYTLEAVPNKQGKIAVSVKTVDTNVLSVAMKQDKAAFVAVQEKSGYYTNEFPLEEGKTSTVTVKVTAENGTTAKEYTITVTRKASAGSGSQPKSSNAELLSLSTASSLSGVWTDVDSFHSSIFEYVLKDVENTQTKIALNAVPADTKASKVEMKTASGAYAEVSKTVTGEYKKEFNLTEGVNKISIKVTAEDGIATGEYTVSVKRLADSGDGQPAEILGTAFLKDVQFSAGDEVHYGAVSNFTKTVFAYTLADTDKIAVYFKVTPESADVNKIEIKDESSVYLSYFKEMTKQADGSYVGKASLRQRAKQNITVKTTSADRFTSKEYVFTITQSAGGGAPAPSEKEKNADLALLETSTDAYGTFISVPGFASATVIYNLNEVPAAQTKLAVHALPAGEKASSVAVWSTAEPNWRTLTKSLYDQYYSKEFSLNAGANELKIKVTAEDTTVTKEYKLAVVRKTGGSAPGLETGNANLKSIEYKKTRESDDGTKWMLIPNFSSSVTAYSLEVENGWNTIAVSSAVEADINKVEMRLGYGSFTEIIQNAGYYTAQYNLTEGLNKIEIKVTAKNGTTKKTYTVNVTRKAASDANIKFIKLSKNKYASEADWWTIPVTSALNYDATAENNISKVAVRTAVVAASVQSVEMKLGSGSFATVYASGGYYTEEFNIAVGNNKIQIKVTAADGKTTKTYTLNLVRQDVNGGTPTPPEPETKAKYGILLYGCGGGNLDDALDMNLREAAAAGTNANVKMAAQYKYSKKFQSGDDAGTFRKVLQGNTWVTKQTLSNKIPLYRAQTLTDFINWAAREIPAEHYILIVWNHGDVWSPYDDSPIARSLNRDSQPVDNISPSAVIYDDILNNEALSTASLAKGITDSQKPIKTVYFDVCLMLMMETLQEINVNAPVVEYCMGAEHLTPGMGGNYRLLLGLLGQNDGVSYEQKMKDYIIGTATAANWWNRVSTPHDLTMIKMSRFGAAVAALKDYVDTFDTLADQVKGGLMSYAYASRYQKLNDSSNTEKSTDLLHFMGLLSRKHEQLEPKYNAFRNALRASYIENRHNIRCTLQETSVGIYVMRGFKNSYDSTIYKDTKFDQAVRWSRMLNLNF